MNESLLARGLAGLLLLPGAATAAQVYDSPADDGAPGPAVGIPTNGSPVVINLYIDGGPAESPSQDKCSGSGSGDELCGWDLALAATGGLSIDAFTPEPGVLFTAGGQSLRANAVTAVDPTAGPQRIGALTVSAVGDGELLLTGNASVPSTLIADPLAPAVLALTGLDTDSDGVRDDEDNCSLLANAGQRDSNGDGFGNVCDPDLDDDGVVNFSDLASFKDAFFTTPGDGSWNPDADFDGDDLVNFADLGTLKDFFFQSPGPSGLNP